MKKCDYCGRQFKSPQALGGHIKNVHAGEGKTGANPDLDEEADSLLDPEETTIGADTRGRSGSRTDPPLHQAGLQLRATERPVRF